MARLTATTTPMPHPEQWCPTCGDRYRHCPAAAKEWPALAALSRATPDPYVEETA